MFQLCLDALEHFGIDDTLVLAFVDLVTVAYLADIDRIGEQMPQVTGPECIGDVVGSVSWRATAYDLVGPVHLVCKLAD